MDWKKIFTVIFFWIVPFAVLFWLIYRAMWTLSCIRYKRLKFTQINIKAATINRDIIAFQYGKSQNIFTQWLYGWPIFWLIPFILFSPGFWGGVFWTGGKYHDFEV